VKYDRCEGSDTSGSIYDGKCSNEAEETAEETVEETAEETAEETDNTIEEDLQENITPSEDSVKDEDYTVENDFTYCPIIQDIQNPLYIYTDS
jgi:hypothetical protein